MQQSISLIIKRAKVYEIIVKLIFAAAIIFVCGLIIMLFLLSFAPETKFDAVKGNLDWNINYSVGKDLSLGIYIPFKIIQPVAGNMFSGKSAFLTYILSRTFINMPILLYGIKQVLAILNFTISNKGPLVTDNAIRLKRLAYSIILYSVTDIILSLLCWIFVTNIFYINLSTIRITGILYGGLIFIIADIFKYGVLFKN